MNKLSLAVPSNTPEIALAAIMKVWQAIATLVASNMKLQSSRFSVVWSLEIQEKGYWVAYGKATMFFDAIVGYDSENLPIYQKIPITEVDDMGFYDDGTFRWNGWDSLENPDRQEPGTGMDMASIVKIIVMLENMQLSKNFIKFKGL